MYVCTIYTTIIRRRSAHIIIYIVVVTSRQDRYQTDRGRHRVLHIYTYVYYIMFLRQELLTFLIGSRRSAVTFCDLNVDMACVCKYIYIYICTAVCLDKRVCAARANRPLTVIVVTTDNK